MASLNKVMLIGRLGADVEVRTVGEQSVARLRLCTDESYTDRNGQRVERSEWHTVSVWGKQADFCKSYLGKGSLVMVEGKLTTREWQEKDGSKRYATEVKAERVQGLDKRENAPLKTAQGRNTYPSEMDDLPF